MSETSQSFELSNEKLADVFVFLANIIGQVELLTDGQYGELTEQSSEFIRDIGRNACSAVAYWCQLKQNIDNQKEESINHLAIFLHDSRASLSCVRGFADLLLEIKPEELTKEQTDVLKEIVGYWQQVEDYWQYLSRLFYKLAKSKE